MTIKMAHHWGSDPQTLKMLYITIIRSHFNYACIFYSDVEIHLLKKVDIIQNKALYVL